MRFTHLRPADYREMPWKNGRGTTVEIAREPDDGEFAWRVSIATVASDGPFSRFPGYDRVILTLEGAGMILTHDGDVHATLGLLEPWSFRGDCDTSCELRDGAIRDFNVVVRRDAFKSQVAVRRLTLAERIEPAGTTLLYLVSGHADVEGESFGAGDTLRLEAAANPEGVALLPAGECTVIRVDLERVR